jgi:alkylation response protein AidB-like acyl-CoA dehydrogenase
MTSAIASLHSASEKNVSRRCLQTYGGFGFAEECDVGRKFRGTRLYQVAPISTNLILSFQAERALGLPKSY